MSAEIVEFAATRVSRTDPVLNQVEAYWDGLRNGRPAPSRAEVDPRGLAGVLRHAFILEKIAPGMARFRVAGQELADLTGLEVRGLPFSALFFPEARDLMEPALERVFSKPEVLGVKVASPRDFKRERIEGRMLLLPLRSDLGDFSRVLGCLSMDRIDGPRPRRLLVEATAPRSIPVGHPPQPDDDTEPTGTVIPLRRDQNGTGSD